MKSKKFNLPLIFLLLITFFIRIYKIDNLSLFGDEIDVGYQAYSLLKTGHDYKGNFLPSYLQSLSESRAPLLIYTSIPGIKLFGLTEVGVRITPIIFGVLSIFLFYKLVFLLSKSKTLSIYSSTILSLSPWHFHYSRTSFEVTLLLSLVLAGTYFAYKYIGSNKNKHLYLSIIFYSLSFYTYNTANIFVPLIVIFIFVSNLKIFLKNLNLKTYLISFFIFLLIASPLISNILFGNAANRFKLISIFNNQEIISKIINKRTDFTASSLKIESIFHNKPIAWINEFSKNYLSSFSIPFLFIFGDTSNVRHTINEYGLFFVSLIPFLFFGLFNLNFKEKLTKLMFFWLLISPIATSLTYNGGNHPTRLFLMIIPIVYFSAQGLVRVLNFKNIYSRIFIFISTILFLIQIIGFTHEYFVHYPKSSFESWNYGYKELFKSIPKTKNNIFISNAKYNSLLPFVFYQNFLINNHYLNDSEKENIYSNFNGFKLEENIYFINDFKEDDRLKTINETASPGDVFVMFQKNDIPGDMDFSKKPLNGFKTIITIYNPNNTILAQIIQKNEE